MNQTPELYLQNENNIFHQLRGHFLTINQLTHSDFTPPIPVEKEKKPEVDKKPLQLNILEARMQKLQYQKLKKKGEQTEQTINLQTQSNTNGYFSMDYLFNKLAENDVEEKVEIKLLNWNKLDEETQKQKLRDFLEKFKNDMEYSVWKEMSKDVLKKRNELDINWHKQSQKIMEINGLIINPSCFYWD